MKYYYDNIETKGGKFDHILERIFNIPVVLIKRILTKFGLRQGQSCKYCGRTQFIEYKVPDSIWNQLPKRYKNKVLCCECYVKLHPFSDAGKFISIIN